MTKQKNKTWKTAATYDTYEEANEKRNLLLEENDLVKVRMANKGTLFHVKVCNLQKNKK